MANKRQYWLWGLLILATALMMTQSFEFGMMGIVGFGLAYLTKGVRRQGQKAEGKRDRS